MFIYKAHNMLMTNDLCDINTHYISHYITKLQIVFRPKYHPVWIGLTKSKDDCFDSVCRGNWNWEDGTAYQAMNVAWFDGLGRNARQEPDKGELCVRLNRLETSHFYGSHCNHQSFLGSCLCEKHATTATVVDDGCPFGAKKLDNKCYEMTSSIMNYSDCVQNCQENGGTITSISSLKENNIIAAT